jgi:hypothetical protein
MHSNVVCKIVLYLPIGSYQEQAFLAKTVHYFPIESYQEQAFLGTHNELFQVIQRNSLGLPCRMCRNKPFQVACWPYVPTNLILLSWYT